MSLSALEKQTNKKTKRISLHESSTGCVTFKCRRKKKKKADPGESLIFKFQFKKKGADELLSMKVCFYCSFFQTLKTPLHSVCFRQQEF